METVNKENYWLTPDKVPLYYRCFPGAKSDCFVSIIHGFAEHSDRYHSLITALQAAGQTVLIHDLRGHGRSGGPRGHVEFWEQYWEDFRGLTRHVLEHSEISERQTILLGHSLGGLIALEGALRDGNNIRGLILSSPCLGLRLAPGLKLLNDFIAHYFPSFSYAHPVLSEHLSRDVSSCQAYDRDPLILKRMCPKTLREMLRACHSLQKPCLKLDFPIWFLAAGNERVVDLTQTRGVYDELDAPFKKLKIFEGFRHEIFNEVCKEIAYDTVLQAIEQIVQFKNKVG